MMRLLSERKKKLTATENMADKKGQVIKYLSNHVIIE